jgi:DNA invertase Pin-like site-specific DNA recombinase
MDAQRAAVEAFARQAGRTILAEYIEVESGKRADRPELAKALQAAKKAKARRKRASQKNAVAHSLRTLEA